MDKRAIKQKLFQLTEGVFRSIADVILLELWLMGDLLMHPTDISMRSMLHKISENLDHLDHKSIYNSIRNAKRKKLVIGKGILTRAGKNRIETLLPGFYPSSLWNGQWEVVIFDIPEKERRKRDILRVYLKSENFGKLQESVWISPSRHSEELANLTKELRIRPYVLVAYTPKIGEEQVKNLADRIWGITEINQQYQRYLAEYRQSGDKFGAITQFLSTYNRDPKLPKQLLPSDWKGEEAFRLYQKYRR